MTETSLLPPKPPTLFLTNAQFGSAIRLHWNLPEDFWFHVADGAALLHAAFGLAVFGGSDDRYVIVFDNDDQMAEFKLRYLVPAEASEESAQKSSVPRSIVSTHTFKPGDSFDKLFQSK